MWNRLAKGRLEDRPVQLQSRFKAGMDEVVAIGMAGVELVKCGGDGRKIMQCDWQGACERAKRLLKLLERKCEVEEGETFKLGSEWGSLG